MPDFFKADEQFRAQLVQLYNQSIELLDGTLEPVMGLIEAGDVVVAVWADTTAPLGIDLLSLKGNRLLREMMAGEHPGRKQLRITVVPCRSYDHAVAAKETLIDERDLDA